MGSTRPESITRQYYYTLIAVVVLLVVSQLIVQVNLNQKQDSRYVMMLAAR
jgi:hypothetical protein